MSFKKKVVIFAIISFLFNIFNIGLLANSNNSYASETQPVDVIKSDFSFLNQNWADVVDIPQGCNSIVVLPKDSKNIEINSDNIEVKASKNNDNVFVEIKTAKNENGSLVKFEVNSKEYVVGINNNTTNWEQIKEITPQMLDNNQDELIKEKKEYFENLSSNFSKSLKKTKTVPTFDTTEKKIVVVEKEENKVKSTVNIDPHQQLAISLAGGNMSSGGGVDLNGEVIYANNKFPVFFQASAMINNNSWIKRYGFSAGAGLRTDEIEVLGFLDSVSHKFDEQKSTFHYQLRPTVRYRTKAFALTGFYAFPISKDQGIDVFDFDEQGKFEVVNKALAHAGVNIEAIINENIGVELDGFFAKGGVLDIGAKAKYFFNKCLTFFLEGKYSKMGDYNLNLPERSLSNYSTVRIGATYDFFGNNQKKIQDLRKKIIVKTDYPIVVQGKKYLNKDKDNTELAVTLTGNPLEGYAPLDVSYESEIKGGTAPYKIKWHMQGIQANASSSKKEENSFNSGQYTKPGTYNTTVTVTDSKGKTATSNVVTVLVLDKDNPTANDYIVDVSSSNGGCVEPFEGKVGVKKDSDKTFLFKPEVGYKVSKVLVDSKSIECCTNYQFKKINADHKLYVEFVKKAEDDYTIVASSSAGGNAIPEGNIIVKKGNNKIINSKAEDGYILKDVLVDGKSVGAKANYEFTNVNADHTIHFEFTNDPNAVMYTIKATAGEGGSINPAGDIKVKNKSNKSFSFIADTNYSIKDILVDGKSLGVKTSYEFTNITSNHTIHVKFEKTGNTVPQKKYTIKATAGTGGTITPAGNITVGEKTNKTFNFTTNEGYILKDVKVDGKSVGAKASYTFTNITANHTIHGDFELKKYKVISSAGTGGTITPKGTSMVSHGGSISYKITPSDSSIYEIQDVKVDGKSVGAVSSYTISNIKKDTYITVEFKRKKYTITATAGANGSISPAGAVIVLAGSNKTFNFTPQTYYEVDSVVVDGKKVPKSTSYKFSDVRKNHTISVTFKRKIFTIVANRSYSPGIAGSGATGTISNEGSFKIEAGRDKSYTINAGSNSRIVAVKVNGKIVKSSSSNSFTSYTHNFSKVTNNQSIEVIFERKGYNVSVSTGGGGRTDKNGNHKLYYGDNFNLTVIPDTNPDEMEINTVLLNGSNYTGVVNNKMQLLDIRQDNKIHITFQTMYVYITANIRTEGYTGTVNYPGTVKYRRGSSPTYIATPAVIDGGVRTCFVKRINKNNQNVYNGSEKQLGAKSYKFDGVIQDCTLDIWFEVAPIPPLTGNDIKFYYKQISWGDPNGAWSIATYHATVELPNPDKSYQQVKYDWLVKNEKGELIAERHTGWGSTFNCSLQKNISIRDIQHYRTELTVSVRRLATANSPEEIETYTFIDVYARPGT